MVFRIEAKKKNNLIEFYQPMQTFNSRLQYRFQLYMCACVFVFAKWISISIERPLFVVEMISFSHFACRLNHGGDSIQPTFLALE